MGSGAKSPPLINSVRRRGHPAAGNQVDDMKKIDEKRRREILVEQCVPLALRADISILWEPDDHEAAVAAGLIEVPREDYQARLVAVEKRFDECGLPYERLLTSTAEVLAVMSEHNLPNTPDGRATAYLILWEAKK